MPSILLSDNGVISGSAGLKETAASDGTLVLQTTTAGGTATNAVYIDNLQNVGLGVTPSAWQTSASSKALQFGPTGALQSTTANVLFGSNWYANSSGTDTYLNAGTSALFNINGNVFKWFNAPSGTAGAAITFTQAMTLDASGNLLVGTTTQRNSARVTFSYAGSSNNGLSIIDTADTSNTQYISFQNSAGAQTGYISRVGTTNAVIYNTTSDYRLKTVIGPVADAGQRIDALEPIEYTWNVDGSRTRGFLAHKFQEVYANSVSGEKDAVDANGDPVYQAMQASTPEVIADLVAEIQSLRQRLAAAGI